MSEADIRIPRRAAILVGAGIVAAAYALPKVLSDKGGEALLTKLDGVTSGTASAAMDCVLTPEATEGPYHLEGVMSRRNITEGKKGVPLRLQLKVVDSSTCQPIKDADVEIWHASAAGEYSGFDGSGGGETDTRYLRGHQKTNSSGVATFDTIFPGWYPGRSPHIHLKVHVGGNEVHTGQLFFTTAIEKRIYATSRYKSRGQGWTRNSSDGIYQQAGGKSAIAKMKRRSGKKGYLGTLTMDVGAGQKSGGSF